MSKEIQDGFDAIEYPLDFSFKAVCETDLDDQQLIAILKKAITEHAGQVQFKDVATKHSSAGRYVSVTLVVHLTIRKELESVYTALSTCPEVKMTL